MKKLFLTSTLCIGVLFSSISFCNNLDNTYTPEETEAHYTGVQPYKHYKTESGLAIEGRVVKEYVVRIKISKKVLEVINGQNI